MIFDNLNHAIRANTDAELAKAANLSFLKRERNRIPRRP
jgi:hypothetical protein